GRVKDRNRTAFWICQRGKISPAETGGNRPPNKLAKAAAAKPLVVKEEERPVLSIVNFGQEYRSTDRGSKLIQPEGRSPPRAVDHQILNLARVELVISQELESASVQPVGARLDRNVNEDWRTSKLCGKGISLELKFLDRIERGLDGRHHFKIALGFHAVYQVAHGNLALPGDSVRQPLALG